MGEDESQRAKVAAKLANLAEGRPKKNSANLQSYEPVSQSRAAELLNVGTRTVAAASKVERESPEVFAQIAGFPQRLQRSPTLAYRRQSLSLQGHLCACKWDSGNPIF